jgi:hypothetical protein
MDATERGNFSFSPSSKWMPRKGGNTKGRGPERGKYKRKGSGKGKIQKEGVISPERKTRTGLKLGTKTLLRGKGEIQK